MRVIKMVVKIMMIKVIVIVIVIGIWIGIVRFINVIIECVNSDSDN